MTYGHGSLLVKVGEERPFVIDFECENAVLIGNGKGCAEDRTVGGLRFW